MKRTLIFCYELVLDTSLVGFCSTFRHVVPLFKKLEKVEHGKGTATDSKDKMEIARHQRIHGSDQWQLDLQHYLKVLRYKPGAVRNSMALRQSPSELQELFDRYFKDTPKQFIDLLLWARDSNHSFQDLCSSVQVARMKGIRDINVDSLKSVLADCQKMVEVIQMPWTQTIESGSTQNFATLRRLFNTNSQKQS